MRKQRANNAQTTRKHCANVAQTLRKHAQTSTFMRKPAQTCANMHDVAQTLDHLRETGNLFLQMTRRKGLSSPHFSGGRSGTSSSIAVGWKAG
jgi:hypothetical protein